MHNIKNKHKKKQKNHRTNKNQQKRVKCRSHMLRIAALRYWKHKQRFHQRSNAQRMCERTTRKQRNLFQSQLRLNYRQTLYLCHYFGWQLPSFLVKKVKVAHTRLPSVWFRSWFRFSAVSLQVTRVINPAVGCHYFPPGLQLPSQPLRGLLPI